MKRVFLSLSLILVAFTGCGGENPSVPFARDTFTALARGDASVEQKIDWEMLSVSTPEKSASIGEIYLQMPNDNEKAAFRHSFISSFASSFQKQGSADALSGWQLKSDDSAKSVVSAAGEKANIEIGVSKRNNEMKISSLAVTPF